MKSKTPTVPKWTPKPKPIPDDTVYLTKSGDRVKIVKVKQFPVNDDREWVRQMRRESNERYGVVRISDGHALWGVDINTLTPEKL